MLRGRAFQDSDTADSPPVVVISVMARKKLAAGGCPGKQVGPGSTRYPAGTIVGIVAHIKHLLLREESGPEMYVPFNQKVWPSLLNMQVVLRTQADPAACVWVRDAMRSVLSRSSIGQADDIDYAGGRGDDATAIFHVAAGSVRRARGSACVHRNVRSDFVFSGAADAGNWGCEWRWARAVTTCSG